MAWHTCRERGVQGLGFQGLGGLGGGRALGPRSYGLKALGHQNLSPQVDRPMGGCQNYGPFWVPIIIRHLLFRVPKKGPYF